eukprot:933434-Pelagomonas_calceolata.AAC.14
MQNNPLKVLSRIAAVCLRLLLAQKLVELGFQGKSAEGCWPRACGSMGTPIPWFYGSEHGFLSVQNAVATNKVHGCLRGRIFTPERCVVRTCMQGGWARPIRGPFGRSINCEPDRGQDLRKRAADVRTQGAAVL